MRYNDEFILSLTVAEFKAFKRAVAMLCRMGVNYNRAVELLIEARTQTRIERSRIA